MGSIIKQEKKQEGFTYIEVMCAIVILMIGILAQLSTMSLSMLRQREAEKQTAARQIANSTLESIFAARDLGNAGGIESFDRLENFNGTNSGIFLPGWNPVREDIGEDGVHGTADDACPAGMACVVGSYTNSSKVLNEYERNITISNIVESGSTVKKRRVEVKIRYFVGQLQREQSIATIIADLPFYQ